MVCQLPCPCSWGHGDLPTSLQRLQLAEPLAVVPVLIAGKTPGNMGHNWHSQAYIPLRALYRPCESKVQLA